MFKSISILWKILVPVVLISVGTSAVLYINSINAYEEAQIQSYKEKARGIVAAAESARDLSALHNKEQLYKDSLVFENLDGFLKTVPIISSIDVAKGLIKKINVNSSNQVQFRVPKMQPRNPDNQPDEFEEPIIKAIFAKQITSDTVFNWQSNGGKLGNAEYMRYFSPISLTQDCMKCHGDPKTSLELWGNNEGKDVTGTLMEGWRVGDTPAAYEVLIPLDGLKAAIAEQQIDFATYAGIASVFMILISFFVANSIKKNSTDLIKNLALIEKGDFSQDAYLHKDDEMGKISKGLNQMRLNLSDLISFQKKEMEKLKEYLTDFSLGKFNHDYHEIHYTDNIKETAQTFISTQQALIKVDNSIVNFINEMNNMSQKHDEGAISVVMDENKYQGAFNQLAIGVNKMVNGHIAVKKLAINCIQQWGNGNFEATINRLPGEKAFINEALDAVRSNLLAFKEEMDKVINSVKIGKLKVKVDETKFNGDWKNFVAGLGSIIETVEKPINEAGILLRLMSEGDFTNKMNGDYNGEFLDLKNNLNNLINSFTELLTQMGDAVVTTKLTSEQLSESSAVMARASNDQYNQSEEIAAAVEEMARTVSDNASNAVKTSDVANSNGEVAREGGIIVNQTIQKMKDIATVVYESANKVDELGKSSKEIGEIISVIDDIAAQTNLLALNAAIEAARAGDQGRGFAVVADEVRKLAERTSEATKKIAEMIKGIQEQTESAVNAMKSGNKEVEIGINLADNAGKSLNQILANAENVLDMINQIAAASEEQSSTSEQISKNVVNISNVASNSAKKVEEISRSAFDLNKLTDTLTMIMSQFKYEQIQMDKRKNGNRLDEKQSNLLT